MLYFVTYDLNRPGQNYPQLWGALNGLGARRCLESVWFLRSSAGSEALRNDLMRFIDQNDRLLVIQGGTWAWWNVLADPLT